MKLPKFVFVTVHKENDGSEWLSANASQVDAVDDSDHEVVAVGNYQLVKVNKLRLLKTVGFVAAKSRKARG